MPVKLIWYPHFFNAVWANFEEYKTMWKNRGRKKIVGMIAKQKICIMSSFLSTHWNICFDHSFDSNKFILLPLSSSEATSASSVSSAMFSTHHINTFRQDSNQNILISVDRMETTPFKDSDVWKSLRENCASHGIFPESRKTKPLQNFDFSQFGKLTQFFVENTVLKSKGWEFLLLKINLINLI